MIGRGRSQVVGGGRRSVAGAALAALIVGCVAFTAAAPASAAMVDTAPVRTDTGGAPYLESHDLTSFAPVLEDCAAGLTGSVSNIDQTAKTAVLSGTGAPGAIITVTSLYFPVKAVVDASGNWTATLTEFDEGYNHLWAWSSDVCPPVEFWVIIGPLDIPIAHPGTAAAVGVLGVGVLGFSGLLRRRA